MPIATRKDMKGRRWPDAEVLFDDTFDRGFDGWRDHMSASVPTAPLSRTALRTFDNSAAALMMSTGPRPNIASPDNPYAHTGTYKNLSRYVDSGYVEFQAWLALGSQDIDNAPYSFFIGIDAQTWDNVSRGFPKLTCRRFSTPTTGGTKSNDFVITDDAGVASSGLRDSAVAKGFWPGDNENKMNWGFMSLIYQLDFVPPFVSIANGTMTASDNVITTNVAHGLTVGQGVRFASIVGAAPLAAGTPYYVKTAPTGTTFTVTATMGGGTVDITTDGTAQVALGDGLPGRYYAARIGHKVFDLRSLNAGRGMQAPQTASPFSGGLNFGVGVDNRTSYTAAGPSWLLMGRARALWTATAPTLTFT